MIGDDVFLDRTRVEFRLAGAAAGIAIGLSSLPTAQHARTGDEKKTAAMITILRIESSPLRNIRGKSTAKVVVPLSGVVSASLPGFVELHRPVRPSP